MYVVMCSARRSEESLSTASRSDVDFVKLACEVLLVIDKASHFKTKTNYPLCEKEHLKCSRRRKQSSQSDFTQRIFDRSEQAAL